MSETRKLAAILVADFLGHCRHASAGSSSKLLKGGWRTEISSPTRGDSRSEARPTIPASEEVADPQRGHGRL
jgi:hypothetical protein